MKRRINTLESWLNLDESTFRPIIESGIEDALGFFGKSSYVITKRQILVKIGHNQVLKLAKDKSWKEQLDYANEFIDALYSVLPMPKYTEYYVPYLI